MNKYVNFPVIFTQDAKDTSLPVLHVRKKLKNEFSNHGQSRQKYHSLPSVRYVRKLTHGLLASLCGIKNFMAEFWMKLLLDSFFAEWSFIKSTMDEANVYLHKEYLLQPNEKIRLFLARKHLLTQNYNLSSNRYAYHYYKDDHN